VATRQSHEPDDQQQRGNLLHREILRHASV
jgi:hypothetical protein